MDFLKFFDMFDHEDSKPGSPRPLEEPATHPTRRPMAAEAELSRESIKRRSAELAKSPSKRKVK